jgi:hypothetical protein
MKHAPYRCPTCGSMVTKSCAVAHEQAVSNGPAGTSQRDFADRVAPPKAPVLLFAVAVVSTFFAVIALVEALTSPKSWVTAALLIPVAVVSWPWFLRRRAAYRQDKLLYASLWTCLDCGKIFQPPPLPRRDPNSHEQPS